MFEDVPERLASGEAVPRTEILAYMGSYNYLLVTNTLNILVMMGCMERTLVMGVSHYALTPYGMSIRLSFISRLEGDCPECP